jgi:hypothetical protein
MVHLRRWASAVKFKLLGGFCSPLLPFLPGKFTLASFERDQFLLRRL